MKKCPVCWVGTWVVGLAAVAWGAFALNGGPIEFQGITKIIALIVGVTGVGFLFFQPPMKPCPRCVKAEQNR